MKAQKKASSFFLHYILKIKGFFLINKNYMDNNNYNYKKKYTYLSNKRNSTSYREEEIF